MNELIKITNQNGDQIVSARELHDFLEVASDFTHWTRRMFEYGFEDGKDFTSFLTKNGGGRGRPSKDFALTLDTAKEISMLQRTEKGKLARRYFIDCEKELKDAGMSLPKDYSEALRELASNNDILEKQKLISQKQEEQLSLQAPMVNAYETISNSSRLSSVSQVSALFGTGRNRFYKMLKKLKFVMVSNKPYQPFITKGLFDYKIDTHPVTGKQHYVTLITGKGILFLQKVIAENCYQF